MLNASDSTLSHRVSPAYHTKSEPPPSAELSFFGTSKSPSTWVVQVWSQSVFLQNQSSTLVVEIKTDLLEIMRKKNVFFKNHYVLLCNVFYLSKIHSSTMDAVATVWQINLGYAPNWLTSQFCSIFHGLIHFSATSHLHLTWTSRGWESRSRRILGMDIKRWNLITVTKWI